MEKKKYRVIKQFSQGATFATAGAILELTAKQAEYLVAAGNIEPMEKSNAAPAPKAEPLKKDEKEVKANGKEG